jgi:hypothetical protein
MFAFPGGRTRCNARISATIPGKNRFTAVVIMLSFQDEAL